ncbi:MAG TPA: cytochrome P450 [Anaerolineales bacterium]|nr:cytochrome P450 [Anaerolineales bacterium]
MQGTLDTTRATAPTPTIRDLIGFLPKLWKQPPLALIEAREKYGDIIRLGFHSKTILHLISHPAYISQVLQTNNRNYCKKSLYHHHLFRHTLGNGLLTSEGDLWLRQRRMIQPIFHHSRLVPLVPIMTAEVEKMLVHWDGYYQRGEPLDVYEEMVDLTRRINGRILFGDDVVGDVVDSGRRVFSQGARFLLLTGNKIPSHHQRNLRIAQRQLDEAVWGVINDRVANPKEVDDVLNMLLSARDRKTGEPMPLHQLRDELMTLIFAGYETTEKALAWSWYLLSQNPAEEGRLYQEVAHTLAGRAPTFEDLPNLEYTRRVAYEALRLYPPAWIQGREAVEDDEIGGYHIPAGSYIVMNQFGVHRHPDFWKNPNDFDPDRFLPERSQDRPRFAYSPFGGGPRQCIGNELALMETQIVLSIVAQQYRPRMIPDFPVELEPEVTLKPRNGLKVILEKTPLLSPVRLDPDHALLPSA